MVCLNKLARVYNLALRIFISAWLERSVQRQGNVSMPSSWEILTVLTSRNGNLPCGYLVDRYVEQLARDFSFEGSHPDVVIHRPQEGEDMWG